MAVDTCSDGWCSAHTGNPCASGDACNNTCNEGSDDCYSPDTTTCNDELYCNGDDHCDGTGTCGTHTGDPCASNDECADNCDEIDDDCFADEDTACTDDGNTCTNNTCSSTGTCEAVNNTASCNDDIYCNGTDTCSDGWCSAHTGNPCASGDACNNTCNEGSDDCYSPDTTTCNDELYCNGDDHCDGTGTCGTHTGDPCASNDECNNTCNEGRDDCYSPDTTSCTDVNPMTLGDHCDGSGACAGTYYCIDHDCWDIPPSEQDTCHGNTSEMTCTDFPCEADGGPDFCGQDAQHLDNDRTFTCYASGVIQNPCDWSADADETVKDSLTGLEWQRTYTINKDWQKAKNYCDTLDYGGHDNWRLPNANELLSIVDYGGVDSPLIDDKAFPGTLIDWFWSSSLSNCITPSFRAWHVDFSGNGTGIAGTTDDFSVRCVRGGPSSNSQSDRFYVTGMAGKELVLDRSTGVMWIKEYETNQTWEDALTYCEGLSYGGYTDWRLPNITELHSLVDLGKYNPASYFPNMPNEIFWSSSTYISNVLQSYHAWTVTFFCGNVHTRGKESNDLNVRCARSGP